MKSLVIEILVIVGVVLGIFALIVLVLNLIEVLFLKICLERESLKNLVLQNLMINLSIN